MRMNRKFLAAVASIVVICAAVPTSLAQERESFQYVVKFVCGRGDGRVVAPGQYFTAINVHNPNMRGVAFQKKFALALPGEKAGPFTKFVDTRLRTDEAYEIDCPDIARHLKAQGIDPGPFAKGFAVIETRQELDVVAVYTAAGRAESIETMDVEHVKPRRIAGGGTEGPPDLIPAPDANGNFCRLRDGKLIVTVRNQGAGAAGASTTRVDFGSGPQSQPTPALPAGGAVDLLFEIPAGCFQPDCHFRIRVDSTDAVAESNEGNNAASGTCIG